jgi:ribosomal RNA-processing protein 36
MSSSAIDPSRHSQSYSFLPKILKDELSALRTAVQLASKAEKNCPLAQKPARTAERELLELQLGRLRTKIERGEREAKEREVLAGAKKEENAKRKDGKGAWYMKKSKSGLLPLFLLFAIIRILTGSSSI